MRYREFGSTGLTVSEIGFGCAALGAMFSQSGTKQDSRRLVEAALSEGITYFDTADMYVQGESEAILGRALRGRRDQVILASKGGYVLPSQRKLLARVKPLLKPLVRALGLKRQAMPSAMTGAPTSLPQDFSPSYLQAALEGSLRRLQTDYLDLYQLHSPPADVIRSGEWVETLERFRQQGKIRFYGMALDTVADARLCLQYPGIASLMFPFGLLDREGSETFLAEAKQRSTALIARGCYGAGLLTATGDEAQLRALTPKWEQILACRRIAERLGRPVLELALQFALGAPGIAVAVLGMSSEKHLRENLGYLSAPLFSEAEYRSICNLEAEPL